MEQFRQIGEVLGSINALMVLQDDIIINKRQCCLLLEIFSLGFTTIADEIRQHLKLEEKTTKWRPLEQPLRELYRVFKEGELYIRYCMDSKDWWGKLVNLHQNKDCVEFHIHNLLCYFPAVIEAIETAGEISGLDPVEMQRRRLVFSRKYDQEWNDQNLFQWRFGKQYLVPREICNRFEHAWREDRWSLVETLQEKRSSTSVELNKYERKLADMLLKKITGIDQSNAKLLPSWVLINSKDYQVRRRLGGGGQYKEVQWLGDSFALNHFFDDIEPLNSEIANLLSLCHPNILQYLSGFYDYDKKECFLVMELMHKDLRSYMKENNGPRRQYLFSLPVVVDLMLQIARGMEYLHSKKIYHGDLNPSNILLKERSYTEGYFHAKVAGFGLSSVKPPFSRATSKPGLNPVNPFIWYAPEVLAELEPEQEATGTPNAKAKYTEKADVYSFGMVCFELLTGKIPFEEGHLQGDKMAKNVRAGERPLFPFPSPKYLVNLTKKCWHMDPDARPSFASVCRILRYIKKFLIVKRDDGHPEMQLPQVDCCDLEARFLRAVPMYDGPSSVTHIPFQMFAYKILEKEKNSVGPKDGNSEVSDSESVSVVEDLPMAFRDTKSLCLDSISEYSDVRSVYSEAPNKKLSTIKKSTPGRLRKSTSTGMTKELIPIDRSPAGRSPVGRSPIGRSPGASPVKARSMTKASPLNPLGRSLRTSSLREKRDSRLPMSSMSPLSPIRKRASASGHASDSELS